MPKPGSHRLPADVRPLAYRLVLEPDLRAFTFQGQASIDVDVRSATDRLQLHAAELRISEAVLTLPGGVKVPAARIAIDEASEVVTLTLARPLPPGKATVDLRFTGTLNDQLRGFYRSQYDGPGGEKRYLATTQFEATDARRAFPCWDEPAAKATFQVTLVVPQALTAISNMPVVAESPAGGGKKAVRFAETPQMSSYLLALVVGDMASVEARAASGTLVRVWTTRGKERQGRFALETAVRLLDYYDDYFGIPYPLPKMDHIAIPDFAAGAMENWGAITYRETALLFDPKDSAAAARQRIAEVVAHEMAHMWFGDLVTMAWWDDLWLNESFASWMGDKAVDHLYPEWKMWTQFIYQDTNAGLALDGLRNSHPIEQKVRDPAEIRELFDAISYSKGAAMLRMIEEHLGEETFRQGLRDYLSAHQYGNARGRDLWGALEKASDKPVTSIMRSWVTQTGFPVLHASVRRRAGKASVSLSQRRFAYDHLLGDGDKDGASWKVPVTIAGGGNGDKTALLMDGREAKAAVAVGKGLQDWVKVNAGQTGFYRVHYAPGEWERLRTAVRRQQLPANDRLGLQDDLYALVRAGHAPATQFLALAEAYGDEDDVSVWSDLSANLRGLASLIGDQPFAASYERFASSLYRKIVRRMGWDARPGEGHLDALLRGTVLNAKGAFGDAALVREARRRFAGYLRDQSSVHPDVRSPMVNLVSQESDRATYDALWGLEQRAQLQEEKVRYLTALGRCRDRLLLEVTLERSLSPRVRVGDMPLVLMSVAGNPSGRDMAWEFVKANWGEIDRRYGKGGFAVTRIVAGTGAFSTMERYDDVERFFRDHPAPSAARTVQQSLERIRLNVKWLERNRRGMARWLVARA